jgi:hypothetical protein
MWGDCVEKLVGRSSRNNSSFFLHGNHSCVGQCATNSNITHKKGSPLSPLLMNLYMRRFVLGWKRPGFERNLGTRLVIYANNLVIPCRRGNAKAALHHLREIMGKRSKHGCGAR